MEKLGFAEWEHGQQTRAKKHGKVGKRTEYGSHEVGQGGKVAKRPHIKNAPSKKQALTVFWPILTMPKASHCFLTLFLTMCFVCFAFCFVFCNLCE